MDTPLMGVIRFGINMVGLAEMKNRYIYQINLATDEGQRHTGQFILETDDDMTDEALEEARLKAETNLNENLKPLFNDARLVVKQPEHRRQKHGYRHK